MLLATQTVVVAGVCEGATERPNTQSELGYMNVKDVDKLKYRYFFLVYYPYMAVTVHLLVCLSVRKNIYTITIQYDIMFQFKNWGHLWFEYCSEVMNLRTGGN